MKRNLLIIMFFIAAIGFLKAQVVADFEPIPLNVMLGGAEDQSTITVVQNPDQSGINDSWYVVKFVRDKDGVPWGGFWSPLPTPVDMTVNKYIHVKVWKTRISPIKFKLEGGPSGTLEIASMNPQTTINAWEDIVFDFSSVTGEYPIIVFMPDFEDPVTLTDDITIYFDDIIVNNDPTPNTAAATIIEDFETIALNLMLGGPDDQSTIGMVPNPDKSGINESGYVVEFKRDKDGVPWGGFWSALATQVDVTDNKYVHVKVWKPRISPVKFKLEGGTSGTLEQASLYPQTLTGEWEDMVFDFTSMTGTYPVIAFMPDFQDPVALTDDIIIYFDDILVNNDPNPIVPILPFEVIVNVDMKGSGLAGTDVYLAGDFGGIYGTWNEPGTNPENMLTDSGADSIYTLTMSLMEGTYHFKFFKAAGWANGEWDGDPNRMVTITGDITLNYTYGAKPAMVNFAVDMHGSGLMAEEPVYIAGNFGNEHGTWNEPGTNDLNELFDDDADSIYTITKYLEPGDYAFKFFKGTSWAGGEWDGDPNRTATIMGDTTIAVVWGVKPGAGIGDHFLADKVNVYPVPYNNYMNINTSVDLKAIVVSSTIGQQIFRIDQPAAGITSISTTELSNGLYFVTFYPKTGLPYTIKTMKY